MLFTDTHTHLYDKAFEADRHERIQKAIDAGVGRLFLPNVDLNTIQPMLDVVWEFPEQCFPMMGLHPCDVHENYQEVLNIMHTWFAKRTFYAVGEIGLDFYWSTEFKTQQIDAFTQQMEWALALQLPIAIHSRNSMDESIELVQPFAQRGLRGVFHCFSGNADQAKQIIDMEFYVGIGGVLTYKNSGLAQAIENVPLDWMVLETDAPYLAPVPHRGKRNESVYLIDIAHKLAELKQCGIKHIAEITTQNSKKLFGI